MENNTLNCVALALLDVEHIYGEVAGMIVTVTMSTVVATICIVPLIIIVNIFNIW